jgi:hypothetical protein
MDGLDEALHITTMQGSRRVCPFSTWFPGFFEEYAS